MPDDANPKPYLGRLIVAMDPDEGASLWATALDHPNFQDRTIRTSAVVSIEWTGTDDEGRRTAEIETHNSRYTVLVDKAA